MIHDLVKAMRLKNLLPIIGVIIFVYILSQLNFDRIVQIFSQIRPFYAFLSFFVFVPLLLLVNVEWQLLLKRQQINVSFWYSIKNFFIGYFYGFITPGGFGGYTRSLYLSKESGQPLAKCLSNIVTFNTIEFLALLSLGFIGALFLSSVYPYLFIIILIVVMIVLLLYVFFFKWSGSHLLFQKIVKSAPFSKITRKLQNSLESFHKDVPNLRDAILPFSLSITGWLLKYILLFFIAQMFDISIPLHYFILILAVADVIASIPISIYGIGTREAALITMLSVPHFTNGLLVSAEQIVSLSLFWFVIIWLTPSIIGAFITLYETKRMFTFNLDETNCERFAQYMKKYPNLYQNLARRVKDYAEKVDYPVIIDLGIGPGLLSKEIKQMIPSARIIGIDPSKKMLAQTNKNVDIETMIGSVEKIPLEESSVDVIVTRYTLPYWTDVNLGFQQINRVLKPGGVFILEALNRDFPKYKLLLIKLQMLIKNSTWSVAQYHVNAYKTAYRFQTVLDLLEKNVFDIIQKEYHKNDWRFLVIGKKGKK